MQLASIIGEEICKKYRRRTNQCGDFDFKMRSNFIRSKNQSRRAGLEWGNIHSWIALRHVKNKNNGIRHMVNQITLYSENTYTN